MSILQISLSSCRVLSDSSRHFLTSNFSNLSISNPPKSTTIRMGGGPRTYPGGVSKWQWKRMQAKKAKQLLKARLSRERQIYEMRKRAELKAAVSELERPWEVVEKAPNLFSASADEQVKVLADRFQKPGGFDLWSEKDGPQLFETLDGVVPSFRFFPKGVVHCIKPYGRITDDSGPGLEETSVERNGHDENSRNVRGGLPSVKDTSNGSVTDDSGRVLGLETVGVGEIGAERNGYVENSRKDTSKVTKGKYRKNGDRRTRSIGLADSGGSNGRDSGFDQDVRARGRVRQSSGERFSRGSGRQGCEFDMSLLDDGSYGFSNREAEVPKSRRAE